MFTLISSNTNRRSRRAHEQADALLERHPDVVALQEVTGESGPLLAGCLARGGLIHTAHSAPIKGRASDSRARSSFVLVAGLLPLSVPSTPLRLPWPEKSLSLLIRFPFGSVEVHPVHVPPGSSNGWDKVECLEAIFRGLGRHSRRRRVLCGDFNIPQLELASGKVVTWAQELRAGGVVRTKRQFRGGSGERWDRAERQILEGLASFDVVVDVYRDLHGYQTPAYSWELSRKSKTFRRRFDHVFASPKLKPISCVYLQALRKRGLSDHSPIEAKFRPTS